MAGTSRLRRVAMAALLVSCGGDATDPPRVGQLDVTAHTFGGDPDLDGYVIVVNGVPGQAVDPGGGVRLTDLPAGEYDIGLTGVADNCDVQGESPRRVALPPGRTVSVVFDVECFTTGVGISVYQAGADLDEDGFSVSVDDLEPTAITPGHTYVVGRLTPGTHTIALLGVAANCAVQGGPSRTVTIAHRLVEPVDFVLDCTAVTGAIEVTAVTTGDDFDPDDYRAVLDDGDAYVLRVNGTLRIQKLVPGSYTVRLESVAPNCQPITSAALTVTVSAGGISRIDYHIVCARTEIIAFTRATDSQSILLARADGSGASLLVPGQDLTWSRDGSRIAYLMPEDFYCDFYYYYCTETVVVANRDGSNASVTGLDGAGPPALSPDGAKFVVSIQTGSTSRLLMAQANGTGLTEIAIPDFTGSASEPSWSPDGTQIAFACLTGTGPNICVINADGTDLRLITDDAEPDNHPAWSPDGTQLAFTRKQSSVAPNTIAVVGVDGTGLRTITAGEEPTWSGDGSRLAFRISQEDAARGIYIVNADGSGLRQITTDPSDRAPAWRP